MGRVVFDNEKVSGGAPYFLETALLALNIAFDEAGAEKVIIHVKTDNHRLLRFVRSLGFIAGETCTIRGQGYLRLHMCAHNRVYLKYMPYLATRKT